MSATIVESGANLVTIVKITIPFEGFMLASEESIQTHLKAAGVLANGKVLAQFDTDGLPLVVSGQQRPSAEKLSKAVWESLDRASRLSK